MMSCPEVETFVGPTVPEYGTPSIVSLSQHCSVLKATALNEMPLDTVIRQ